ncbi:MAG: alginate biosynthesis protein AlgX [Sinimarinibacterium sp.]|jgi:alginate biosynthesis protein AlgX
MRLRHSPAALAALVLCTIAAGAAATPGSRAGAEAASRFPSFDAAPCCQLCPLASVPEAYNTAFLRSFRVLHEGEHGWLFRSVDDLRTDFGPNDHALRELARLDDALARRGVELVMVVQPPRGLMHRDQLGAIDRARYNAQLAQFSYVHALQRLRSAGLVVPDLERLVYEGGGDSFFFRADHHWTPDGARRTAQLVANRIRAMPEYVQLPRKPFVTRQEGLFGKRGTMHKAVQQLCGFGAREQYVASFVTEPAGESDGAGLLGDSTAPQITLVGTSNSDPAYNFAGFLSQFLEVDVLNAALAGGGFAGSLMTYLASPEFRSATPRILVWEVEAYHDFSDDRFYRQLLPLVDDGCNTRPVLLDAGKALHPGRNEILFNGGGEVRELRSDDYFVDLQFSDPSVHKLDATVWYSNGRRDDVTLEPEQANAAGRFMFELRDDGEWAGYTFLALDVQMDPAPPDRARLEARLCPRVGGGGAATTASAEAP